MEALMNITEIIQNGVISAVKEIYDADITQADITLTPTRKEFEGDYTVVVFPFSRIARKKPEAIGEDIGTYLLKALPQIEHFNVIKGFLNLVVSDRYWQGFLDDIYSDKQYGIQPHNGQRVMVEFSSPNTNKPLHLGHIRNILLGWSASRILEAAGYHVVRVQVVNDRGIAICKSMLAWKKYGHSETPESTGMKGDHFVGKYYVLFEQKFQEEYKGWQQTAEAASIFEGRSQSDSGPEAFFKGFKNEYFNSFSTLGAEARELLRQWEDGDPETMALWNQMNAWVYQGFDKTYDKLGVSFDKSYYESSTYLLGKDLIDKGLQEEVFYRESDGSVWVNLEDVNLDRKIVLRSDGTSIYITQDLGTAHLRYEDFGMDRMVYTVADEQNYHFQVLFEILRRLKEPYADGLFHLSYGMVDLPSGKMKSREGTVVDADDLIAEVIAEAASNTSERGTIADLSTEEQQEIIRKIGMAALKFFIIKVQPRKRMIFDPRESVDLQGQTGPYVQNAYVRVQSVLRKAGEVELSAAESYEKLGGVEKELLGQLFAFPAVITTAADDYDPSNVANYCYDLAKLYHRFYHDHSILRAETEGARAFRLKLSMAIANTLRTGMDLLGIEMPEKM